MSRPDWLHSVEQSLMATVEKKGRVALLYPGLELVAPLWEVARTQKT
jgi:hypothetical protein